MKLFITISHLQNLIKQVTGRRVQDERFVNRGFPDTGTNDHLLAVDHVDEGAVEIAENSPVSLVGPAIRLPARDAPVVQSLK